MQTQNVQFCPRFDENSPEKAQHTQVWFAACGERSAQEGGAGIREHCVFAKDGKLLMFDFSAFSSNLEQK